VESELVRGSGGIFVVTADNKRIFDKRKEGRFPGESEIVEQLRALTGNR
jgi:selT/selW/selH-like putative selenoprotein